MKKLRTALLALALALVASQAFALPKWHEYRPRSTIWPSASCLSDVIVLAGHPVGYIALPQNDTTCQLFIEFWMPSTDSMSGNSIDVTFVGSGISGSGKTICMMAGYEVTPPGGNWQQNSGQHGAIQTGQTVIVGASDLDNDVAVTSIVAWNDQTNAACATTPSACNSHHGIIWARRGRVGTDTGCTGTELPGWWMLYGADVSWTGPA